MITPIAVEFRRCRHTAILPTYATKLSSGLDLCAALDNPMPIGPGEMVVIPTGIEIRLPPWTEGQVRSRSGLTLHRGLVVANSPGTIDADYEGEISVILLNLRWDDQTIMPGMRIAQLVISPVLRAWTGQTAWQQPRGAGGFGSTGTGGGQDL